MKSNFLLRAIGLLALFVLFAPANNASAFASTTLPPADMFQLPWEQGLAWVAIDGFDNGFKRPLNSSHNYLNGGAIDFAPHNNMRIGEDTSRYWVTAAAAGKVVEKSFCHLKIDHGNGWITEYQFLANIKVNLGDAVDRNQRLAIIADGLGQKFCPGSLEPDVPHLHFTLRPNMRNATFAGWQISYIPLFNKTTFTKNGQSVGLFQPLLNVLDSQTTPTPTAQPTNTPGNLPSATPTLFGPYVSTAVNPSTINVGETAVATVSLNNVPSEGYTSAEFTCQYDAGLFEVSNITATNLFGADAAMAINGPQDGKFIVAIAGSNGNKANASGAVFTFSVKGLQPGQTYFGCDARVSKGDNVLTEISSALAHITIVGSTATPNLTPSIAPTFTQSPAPNTPTISPTATASNWLTFTNTKYGFQFKYPPEGQIVAGNTDNFARINLPFQPGTNLHEKYLEVAVVENANPCRSPVASSSIVNSSETVTINGIPFLKEIGGDSGVGNIYQFIAYSTLRDNACVSLSFVLHSVNPDNFPTPPPVFDYASETAVFTQIVSTYIWLTLIPTSTPTFSSTPVESPTATFTSTPIESPTATSTSTPIGSPTPTSLPAGSGALTGQVLAGKPVTVSLLNADSSVAASVTANVDGTFSLTAPAGTYTVRATASGFLSAQGSTTLTAGNTSTKPTITLLAGDIDGNNVINQFDAMTIGMNYNAATPAAADLNNDGVINVLDLELLANNYRKTGPLTWQ
jgi:murein DD-endopeptidase MepM/ murein hydrolase activator NlpD